MMIKFKLIMLSLLYLVLSNLTLVGKNFIGNFKVKGSVFNFYDKSDDDPALNNTVPTDYPQPAKSFFTELRYRL